ncbi:hypothetical protein AGMMS50233_06600 [Endomicrobiia bacterium]|nr:hypothetical protein AGMMS49990_10410 [Endomicrobiia bacterium]GHT55896.1 hypothetical protein AGMMS50233_06600 [Endomicrobiia bacterium]
MSQKHDTVSVTVHRGKNVNDKIEKMLAAQVIELAFKRTGGVDRLVQWANDPDHPENYGAFLKIWAKRIPQAVELSGAADNNRPINIHLPAEAAKI